MATRVTPAQQHLFRYQSFQIDKSQPLGHGSYGAVYKAKCDQLPCAAKVLHPTIVDPSNHDPGAVRIMDRFSQECALLESIRHPNIVQYLAMTFDPESRLPVLLMELLDESLTKMLERSPQSLAYYKDKDRESREKERAHQEEKASRERQLRQLNQQLEEQEQVTAEIQHSLQRQVEQLQQQLSQQNPDHKPHPPKEQNVTLNWRDGGKAPFRMSRGAPVVDEGVAYFMHVDGQTCSYNSTNKKWSELPKYPYQFGSLAVVNGQLTAIGGNDNIHTCTNKLLTLRKGQLCRSWSDVFPPMPTKRYGTTAVTSEEHLIVAGGATEPVYADVNTVEVMDTKTLVWSTVASLPHPYKFASATICGDHLYMLGGYDDKDWTKSVLTCSLTELLQSSSSSSVWHRVADVPAYYSTCTAVNGQLLAVGGRDKDFRATAAIHKYNPTTNSWDHISNMPTARRNCFVAVLPTNEMMAVGGWISGFDIDKVDIASISISESK